MPALDALGGRDLDLLILSHADADHAGGAAAVLSRYPGARVMASFELPDRAVERCRAGQSWSFDQVRFSVLHPPEGSSYSGNDGSCVVRVETLAGSLLLTGDIEARAEASLTGIAALAADVVVVPHHGSLTSSTPAFVATVSPRAAIASAAHDNRWNFPRPEVVDRWARVGAPMYVTGDQGAIGIVFDAEGISVTSRRHERRRYWHAEAPAVSGDFDLQAL